MVGLVVAKTVNTHTRITVFAHVEVCLDARVCQVTDRKLKLVECLDMSKRYRHMGMVVQLMIVSKAASVPLQV